MYQHILVPLAFDEHDRDPAGPLAAARALSGPDTRVTLMHVMEEAPPFALSYMPPGYQDELCEAIEALLDKHAAGFPRGDGVLIEGNAGRSIVEWAEENDVDCIVIASHRAGFRGILMGSTAVQVVRHAPCSVHLMRGQDHLASTPAAD
ncbi:universal stress protein [Plastorhodobacter daqingensis]|uniref:Universal stress protein n=1 Tax=Plastorhodobacter daqingensis TaxID=1387281 RepID=A0ABW2UNL3_9RHOB